MRIIDLEHNTGLDRATIRYYEKEGFILPSRKKNGYRDYSEQDEETLLKIKLLRQLGLSLEKIKQIQQGSADFQEAISEQIQILLQNRDGLQRAAQVCKLIQSDGATYQTIEPSYYLKQLATMPLQYRQTTPAPEYKYNYSELIEREYHPILRLTARGIDLFLTGLFLAFIQIVILNRGLDTIFVAPFGWISMLILVPVESISVWIFGTTVGKWLMGIQLSSSDGCKLTLREAFVRAWQVFRYGCGFGIPVWSLWCIYKNYRQYQDEEMGWDEETEISYQKWSFKNVNILIASLLIVIGMIVTCVYVIKLPRNRNSLLNIEEFVENYNDYWKIRGNNTEYGMIENGTLQNVYSGVDGGVATIVLAERSREISYEKEDEKIVGFRYQEAWKDPIMANIFPEEGIVAAMTLLSGLKGQNLVTLNRFVEKAAEMIQKAALEGKNEVQFDYNNLRIVWSVEMNPAVDLGGNNQGTFYFSAKNNADECAEVVITLEALLID